MVWDSRSPARADSTTGEPFHSPVITVPDAHALSDKQKRRRTPLQGRTRPSVTSLSFLQGSGTQLATGGALRMLLLGSAWASLGAALIAAAIWEWHCSFSALPCCRIARDLPAYLLQTSLAVCLLACLPAGVDGIVKFWDLRQSGAPAGQAAPAMDLARLCDASVPHISQKQHGITSLALHPQGKGCQPACPHMGACSSSSTFPTIQKNLNTRVLSPRSCVQAASCW